MRLWELVAAVAAAAMPAGSAGAQDTGTQPPMRGMRYEVPVDGAPQVVVTMTREVPPGGEIPWHIHPGVEMTMVLGGEAEILMPGGQSRIVKAGGGFTVPRAVPHAGRNPGDKPLFLSVAYIVDRDAPVMQPVPGPDKAN